MLINEFYQKNYDRQVNSIRRSLKFNKHLAEDVVQEAYVRAMEHIKSYDEKKGKFGPWFNKILYNTLRSMQLEFGYSISLSDSTEIIDENSLEYFIILHQEINQVKNTKHREVLCLFYINGYTSQEIISQVGGLTRTNVTTICNRFRDHLKERYGLDL